MQFVLWICSVSALAQSPCRAAVQVESSDRLPLLVQMVMDGTNTNRKLQNQGQTSQVRNQQKAASTSTRNSTNVFTGLLGNGMQGSASANIWGNRPETLPRDHTTTSSSSIVGWDTSKNTRLTEAVASAQRSTGLSATDSNNIWSRPSANTWNSSESQQFRPSASRSTSPPSTTQNGSNASPSFSSRIANNTTTAGFAGTNNFGSAYADTAQGNGGLFQQNLMGFQRGTPANQPLYEDRESHLSTSRHPEGETPPPAGPDINAFSTGFGTHSRHASRMSLGGISSFTPQHVVSRSQSQSFLQGSEHSRAAAEATQNALYRSSLQASTPGPRVNGTPASTAAASGWPEFAPIGNTGLQELRRGSVANSVYHPASNAASPHTFVPRQTDLWENAPTPQEVDIMNSLQRQLNTVRHQNTQSPYNDHPFGMYNGVNLQAQMLQQMQNPYGSSYQNYGFQPGQQFYPPTGPAGMMGRGSRVQDPTAGLRCPELEEFRRSSKSNRKWELKVSLDPVVECFVKRMLTVCRTFLAKLSNSLGTSKAQGFYKRRFRRRTVTTDRRSLMRSWSMPTH